jgi:hypothetical protein
VPSSSTSVPATTTTEALSPTPPIDYGSSANWSGYAEEGGPYTSVTGTFTVPSLTTSATCSELTSEWVGIDGVSNTDLIQAGVMESNINPTTGSCSPSSTYVWPWWEILPASAAGVNLTVNPGDSLTVSITQSQGTKWVIDITDNTTGAKSSVQKTYSGPAKSAEWIVEAPTSDQVCKGQCNLAPYSPAVAFSNVNYSGNVSQLDAISMVQRGSTVCKPGGISGWPSSFSVAYSGTQSAPLGGTSLRSTAHFSGSPNIAISG